MVITDEQVRQWAEEWTYHAGYGHDATVDIGGGRSLRARVEIDQDTSISDYEDAYGKVAWVDSHRDRIGHAERPDGFNGAARKLWTFENGADAFWWQPPADVPADSLKEMAESVSMLVTYGFKGVIVELCEGEDAYGRPIVIEHASLWGIDSLEDGYGAAVIADLIGEVLA